LIWLTLHRTTPDFIGIVTITVGKGEEEVKYTVHTGYLMRASQTGYFATETSRGASMFTYLSTDRETFRACVHWAYFSKLNIEYPADREARKRLAIRYAKPNVLATFLGDDPCQKRAMDDLHSLVWAPRPGKYQ
jgi:hypothetical protein